MTRFGSLSESRIMFSGTPGFAEEIEALEVEYELHIRVPSVHYNSTGQNTATMGILTFEFPMLFRKSRQRMYKSKAERPRQPIH